MNYETLQRVPQRLLTDCALGLAVKDFIEGFFFLGRQRRLLFCNVRILVHLGKVAGSPEPEYPEPKKRAPSPEPEPELEPEPEPEPACAEDEISAESGDYAAQSQAKFFAA